VRMSHPCLFSGGRLTAVLTGIKSWLEVLHIP
jgi:hypothetical protein